MIMGKIEFNWKNYGELVKHYRKKRKLTQEQLVESVNERCFCIPCRQSLYRIEKGQQPSIAQFLFINIVLFDNTMPKAHLINHGVIKGVM